jgi:hypothetical protein
VAPILFAIAAIVAAAFWLVGIPKLRERRRRARARQPLPAHWHGWLEEHIPVYRRLPAELRERLHGLIQIFVHEKSFVGCNGLEVTDRMRVVIAAHACLLVINRPGVPYRTLYDELLSILIYPTPFIVPELQNHGAGVVSQGHRVLSGQAWDSRRIILSWEDVELPAGGHNVVLHEFAHYLDMEDETMDGAPGLGSKAAHQQWARVFWEEYDRLRYNLHTGVPTLLDPYAATAPAEFFAVVTEVFFEQPRELEAQHAALYQQLRKYYRIDPARWEN